MGETRVADAPARMNVAAGPRSISRRGFLRMAGLAGGAALAACAPLRPRPRAAERVQLVYQDWRTDWFPPMAQAMLDEFHAQHPNIRVFYTLDPENLEEKMLLDFQAGTAPDVFQGCCSFFPAWGQHDYALDLRPYVAADLDQETIQDWDAAQYRAFFTGDGKQYGLPKYHGALALYYNKGLFDEQHVDYPDDTWTHDDYLAAMKRLTLDRDGDGRVDQWGSMLDISWDRIQVHVNAWGGHFVDPTDATRSLMGEPPALEAMEWLRARIWDDGVMPSSLDVKNMGTRQAFIDQRVAMVEDGSWALKEILSHAPFRIGVAPFPRGPARRVTIAGTDGFGIYAGTRHPDDAWELLKFLVGKSYGRAMARANFLQPARASLLDDWIGYIQAEFPEKAQGIDLAAFADGQLKGYSTIAEVFANQADAQRIAYSVWDRVFTLGQEPVAAIGLASQEIDRAQRSRG